MKALYRGALVLWLVSGFAIHAYFSRADRGMAAVERARAAHDDESARLIHEARWQAGQRVALAYAGWALVGFGLALRGVHLLFRRADRVADVEQYLAASVVLLALAVDARPAPGPISGAPVGPIEAAAR